MKTRKARCLYKRVGDLSPQGDCFCGGMAAEARWRLGAPREGRLSVDNSLKSQEQ